MAQWLKQSTAVTFRLGPFCDSTDGVTAETGLTLSQADFRLSKAGGAFAQKNESTSGSHDENGYYTCILNATDTNTLGTLDINVSESGALPVFKSFMVVPANIYDSLVAGSDLIDVSVVQNNGSAITQSGGRQEVNMTHIAGAAVSTSTAQLGVNVVNFGGSAGTFASGRPETNTSHIAGSAVSTSSAQIGVNVVNAGGTAWGSGAITAASIASGAFTSAKAAAGFFDAVWSVAARVLTANTNLNDLNAAGIRSAIGMSSANLDTQIGTLATSSALSTVSGKIDTVDDFVDTEVAAIKAVTDKLDTALELDGAVYRYTTNALEQAPSGSGLDAAGTRAALGMSSANLDTQLAGINTNIDANETKIDALPTANANADALLDRTAGIETSWTVRQGLRIMLSVLAGKASGLNTTTATYRDMADSKNRISATVDVDGNRSAVTRDAT